MIDNQYEKCVKIKIEVLEIFLIRVHHPINRMVNRQVFFVNFKIMYEIIQLSEAHIGIVGIVIQSVFDDLIQIKSHITGNEMKKH